MRRRERSSEREHLRLYRRALNTQTCFYNGGTEGFFCRSRRQCGDWDKMPCCFEDGGDMSKGWQETVTLEDGKEKETVNWSSQETRPSIWLWGPVETQYYRISRSRCQSYTGLILVHLNSYGFSSVSGLKLLSLLGKLYTRLHRPPASRSVKTRKENDSGSHRKFPSCLLSSAHVHRAEGSGAHTFLSGAMEPVELLLRDQVLQGPVFL